MGDTKTDENKTADNKANQNAEEPSSPAPNEMRAIVLTGFGGLKAVKVMKKPEPTPGEGEVLIRVKACGLNFLDLMVRQGAIDNPPKTPFIMGFECAGIVEAVGEGVTEFKVNDSVVALTEYKAWAELVSVPAKFVYSLPSGLGHQEAASMLMNYVVAYCLLFDIGNLQKGQKVLIHSAGGSVGLAVAALCKTVPDITLIGTASKHKHETIAEYFTHLFDHNADYVQEVKKLFPDGVDLVLDCLCGEDSNKGYNLLKPLGRYALYGTSSIVSGETKSFFSFAKSWWQVDKVSPIKLFDENKMTAGFHLRHLLYQQGCHDYVRNVVNKVFKLWEDKKIKIILDSAWAFEDVAEAMQKLHDRKNIGKITLMPDMTPKPQAKSGKDGKTITSGESTDTEKDAKDEQTPPPFMATVMSSSEKLRKCIINSWNLLNADYKKYLDNVNLGEKYVLSIINHKTVSLKVEPVNIEHTELYKRNPDIKLMLQHAIEREILSEETLLRDVLSDLESNYVNIIVQIDRIFNVYKSLDLKKCEIIKASETSLSFAEMLEALDRFKRFFMENHDGRKCTLDTLHFIEDFEKISSLWKVSELEALKQDLDLILEME